MAPEITPAVTLTAFGLGMTSYQVLLLLRALASRRWPRTTGRIQSSYFVPGTPKSGDFPSAVVQYKYKVAGGRRHGNLVGWNGGFTRRSARRTSDRYNPGQVVTVWYDLRHPERAVLEPGATLASWMRVVFALAFLLVGLVWAVSIVRAT
ncbi:MAG TPA: DUF3592 domain-containing protein [Gemmatimonadaceae bacterium]